jgi:outer membrane protein assembly factor BamB/predicted phosphodiesterase
MKQTLSLLFFLLIAFSLSAQQKPFRFAFISDTHIGSPNGLAEEDLRRTVRAINERTDIAFVVLTGDITELGTNRELAVAKQILDSLDVPYRIIPGNHDTGWSETGGLGFTRTFGDDKFHFVHNGIHFIGCASGPYVRMSDGHVPRHNMNWLESELKKIKKEEPIVFLNHYPLDNGLDNWYEVIDMLKAKNTVLALCGHGHNNRPVNAEAIPAVMGRSNLRAKAAEGGFNLVDVTKDSFLFTEYSPISKKENKWKAVAFQKQDYNTGTAYPRPDFSINQTYNTVKPKWTFSSDANVISTPAVINKLVVFGNQNGEVQALNIENGKKTWSYKTKGPIFSSPAISGDRIVVGSADGNIYCLNTKGKLEWKMPTPAAVLGAPFIDNGTVYIGGSDSCFQAITLATGKRLWQYCGVRGAVTSQPVVHNNTLLFGAWDTHLYAVDKTTGQLLWKWNNGSSVINYSPAACIPVIQEEVVYVVAPDRYLSAIDINNGKTLWRTKEATVRESLGLSADGKLVYGKTMQDTVVAFITNKEKPQMAWKMRVGFGYEHVPSMLIEKDGQVFFGTKSGVVYAINPATQTVNWAHKIDNSMVNTVNVINSKQLIAATMDGKIVLLEQP